MAATRSRTVIVDLLKHPEPIVTVQMLARYWKVSERNIYRDIKKGALIAYQLPGGTIRVRREDAIAYGQLVSLE